MRPDGLLEQVRGKREDARWLWLDARSLGDALEGVGCLPAFPGGGNERRGQFFVEKEEVFDAFPVVLERLRAVAEGNGAIQRSVGGGRGRRSRRSARNPPWGPHPL